jgi:hypothetical protein
MRTANRVVAAVALASMMTTFGTGPGGSPAEVRAATAEEEPRATPQSLDDAFAEIARLAPQFGGLFLREQTPYVYLLDPSQPAGVEEAIVAVLGRGRLPAAPLQFLRGDYSFLQLKDWHDRHRLQTLEIPGVLTTSIAESRNRLRIGVKDAGVIPEIKDSLVRLGVPTEAVEFEEMEPFEQYQTLQSTIRPVLGGTQIQRSGGGTCTMGFTAVRQGVAGFVTNAHCTAVQAALDGSVFNQAVASGSANRFGVEAAEGAAWPCGGRTCRWADIAFAARNSGSNAATLPASAHFGYLALPDNAMNVVHKFHVVGEVGFPLEGEYLTKVGRTTGETSGEVYDTCVDINAFQNNVDTGFTNLCQDRVAANSGPGDSGSPVFTWSSASLPEGATIPARLYGVLWGGSNGNFAFGAMWNIEQAIGGLKTAKEQAGANSPPEAKIILPAGNITVGSGGLNGVDFSATVVDYEGCCQEVRWDSSLDGLIGMGSSFNYVFSLPGTRTITLTAKDNHGAIATDSVVVTVENDAPTVWIVKPTQGLTVYSGSPYVFEGDSWDANEPFQKLSCNSLKWTSSNPADPFPVWGCTPTVTFSTNGARTITLKGTDSDGSFDTDSKTITVAAPPVNGPPTVTILYPAGNNTMFDANTWIQLKGTANDPDNENPLTYTWKLKDGNVWTTLGTGTMSDETQITKWWKPANNVPFSCGGRTVRVYLTVTDPDGFGGIAYVDVYIAYPVC